MNCISNGISNGFKHKYLICDILFFSYTWMNMICKNNDALNVHDEYCMGMDGHILCIDYVIKSIEELS